ncbi:serine protease [Actinomadura graeca]|uniref:Serine protease n=1 Tax=Actinomadura graeca TaxID=2750812 RepID=A0ABX8QZF1_9ACTN|nr:SSI family serine proteinase inhibitor [Actinomadura graeca]QXJ24165.1 serine protease [Actinomadura graeca]
MARPVIAAFRAAAPALAALAVAAYAVPAHAEAPAASLRLTLTYPGRQASATKTVTLRCGPAGGDHPDAARACADLDENRGAFARSPDGRACTMIHAPVIARAEGRWHGRAARFRTEYGNECEMHARTGKIFAF